MPLLAKRLQDDLDCRLAALEAVKRLQSATSRYGRIRSLSQCLAKFSFAVSAQITSAHLGELVPLLLSNARDRQEISSQPLRVRAV